MKARDTIIILVAAALIAATDLALWPILNFYNQASTTTLLYDFSVVLLTGLAGLYLAPRVTCPTWLHESVSSPDSRRETKITILLALSLVAGNTLIQIAYIDQALELAPWLTILTPGTAVAMSLRAALNEEIIFRLFLFPLTVWIATRLKRSQRTSLIIGALASTLAFTLIHPPSGFLLSFLAGLIFIYIYQKRGILPAMAAHFFADAIPLVLTSAMT